MNRIVLFLLLLTLCGTLYAKPRSNKRAAASARALTEQIAAHLVYPAVLQEKNRQGIVVITFSVAEDNRLARLQVHTANQELNNDLVHQLVGKKVHLTDPNPLETYTVRLHFTR